MLSGRAAFFKYLVLFIRGYFVCSLSVGGPAAKLCGAGREYEKREYGKIILSDILVCRLNVVFMSTSFISKFFYFQQE